MILPVKNNLTCRSAARAGCRDYVPAFGLTTSLMPIAPFRRTQFEPGTRVGVLEFIELDSLGWVLA